MGGHPILWRAIKGYVGQGFDGSVVRLGYKGEVIEEVFLDRRARRGGVPVDLATGAFEMHEADARESWKPQVGGGWITGGSMVLEHDVADLIPATTRSWSAPPCGDSGD